jgi:hypothetical protein
VQYEKRKAILIEAFKTTCELHNQTVDTSEPLPGILHLITWHREGWAYGYSPVLIADCRDSPVTIRIENQQIVTPAFLKQFRREAQGVEFEVKSIEGAGHDDQLVQTNSTTAEHSPRGQDASAPKSKGRPPTFSFETMCLAVIEWRKMNLAQKASRQRDPFDDKEEFDAPERLTLPQFLADKFSNGNLANPKVSTRRFQTWGPKFDSGKWKVPIKLRKQWDKMKTK